VGRDAATYAAEDTTSPDTIVVRSAPDDPVRETHARHQAPRSLGAVAPRFSAPAIITIYVVVIALAGDGATSPIAVTVVVVVV